jgi:hypothetical protein
MVEHLLGAQMTPAHEFFFARDNTQDGPLGVRH